VTVIVGVHGIAQQQMGRHQLAGVWSPALRDGLERACGGRVGVPPLDLAFYGDVFLPEEVAAQPVSKGTDADEWLTGLQPDELADLVDTVAEVVGEEAMRAAESEVSKAYTRLPRPLQVVLRSLDRWFGPSAGALFLGELRQVRRYLRDVKVKARVDGVIKETVGPECRVLIGHSLGSVVAFEYVRQNPGHQLDLLLTLGSPLGLRAVRGQMPNLRYGAADRLPASVNAWANIRDIRDPVACAGELRQWWPGIEDITVDNQGDAHSVARYLGKKQTGAVLLAALPELAS
jgi:hypothetical protein